MPGNGQMSAKVLLVTGGIGAGKSAVSRMLIERGVPVYFSDDMAKSLYDRDASLRDSLRRLFGERVFRDGDVDRRALAELIFADEEKRRALEALVHPAVFRDFEAWKAERPDCALVAFESAILLDRGLPEGFADYVIYVDAPEELRLRRAMERDGSAAESVRRRMQSQKAGPEHPAVDFVLDNSGDFNALEAALDGVLRQIASEKL
ncbi:MAG: dephospho-CoA kinase [Candidatus Cryptobacteroides sp.]|nr:dephospho-CoA kinase [Candidatus Cryptobacteroides sp.]